MSKYRFSGGRIYPSTAGVACACAKGTHEQTLSKKTACEVILKNLQLLLDLSAKVQLLVETQLLFQWVDLDHSSKRMSPGLWNRTTMYGVLKLIA